MTLEAPLGSPQDRSPGRIVSFEDALKRRNLRAAIEDVERAYAALDAKDNPAPEYLRKDVQDLHEMAESLKRMCLPNAPFDEKAAQDFYARLKQSSEKEEL